MKPLRWEIVFEDKDCMVINKPAGLLCIPDRYDELKANLQTELSQVREEIFVVHRLDRETSGLIIFAKNQETHAFLNQQFQDQKVNKLYHAFVNGVPAWEHKISEESIVYLNHGKSGVGKGGKKSKTEFNVIKRWKSFSLIECKPHTGRTHQIRVHLQDLGHPLIVDRMYGTRGIFKISEIKGRRKFHLKKDSQERPLLSRHTLHAKELELILKPGGKRQKFIQDYPKDLRALENQLNKLDKRS